MPKHKPNDPIYNNRMSTKSHLSPNSKWFPVLSFIKFLIYYLIFENTYHYIFSDLFGPIIGLLCTLLCILLITFVMETAIEKCRSFYKGTVYGTVVLNSDNTSPAPIKNVEVSWGPSHHLRRKDTPVITDEKGEFRFENLPLRPHLTLTAKLTNNRYVHQVIGEIEGVRWFLGRRWLGFPMSSGIPKRVDFMISD